MDKQEILENLNKAIINGDQQSARENAQKALDEGLDPLEAVDDGLSKGMEVVGAKSKTFSSHAPMLRTCASREFSK